MYIFKLTIYFYLNINLLIVQRIQNEFQSVN